METEVHKGPKWNVYITGYANDHEHVQHAVSGVGNYSYDPARILSRKKLSRWGLIRIDRRLNVRLSGGDLLFISAEN